ncbi:beta-lactamase family protein [Marivita sp. S6314]|uniref:serine hydrolase domain-containing protein n=1 Tax=Marivita sp. S6314 TaxID=2926406 RepID=UPI001FF680F9|nr:serine hydrolase domain-containing protein [Marivita sp. S6314]MCK0149001.1 beta-lactamase family protein [Marivita sp. S6314]
MRSVALLLTALWLPQLVAAHDTQSVFYASASGHTEIDISGDTTTKDTAFPLASIGKTMTAVAILRLVDGGLLSLDDPASDWVSGDIATGFGGLDGITIRHLLTMTSGLPEYYTQEYLNDALETPDQVQTASVALGYAMDTPPLFPPGTAFDYSNTNYVLLGLIAERATGKSYADLMAREVFDPAGMTSAFVFGSRRLPATVATGHEDGIHIRDYYEGPSFGDGGVIATAGDLARFYWALFVEKSLLGPDMRDALLTDPVGAGYGMGIDIDGDIVGHSGGDLGVSTDVRMNLETGAIAILLVGEADAETDQTWDAVLP